MRDGVVEQALKIIRNRIDQFGVTEPTIQKQGSSQIVVQLPGIQDPQRAKELIGRTAQLEFKLVSSEQPGRRRVESLPGKGDDGGRGTYLVEKRTLLTGDSIVNASVRPGSGMEGMAVDFQFDARGAQVFGDITRAEHRPPACDRSRQPRRIGAGDPRCHHRRTRPDHRQLRRRRSARSSQRAAPRRTARAAQADRGAHGRPVSRQRLHSERQYFVCRRQRARMVSSWRFTIVAAD